MRFLLTVVTVTLLFASTAPCSAQSLSSRPSVFADPLLTSDPTKGELVLGRTTLVSALRIFAVELQDTSGRPVGTSANPDTVGGGSGVSDSVLRAHYRLDIGPDRYLLYFDHHQRLVAVLADRARLKRLLRREDLVARYATLRSLSTGLPGAGTPGGDLVVAQLAPCVASIATIRRAGDPLSENGLAAGTVSEFGYIYTCPTRPSAVKATLDRDR